MKFKHTACLAALLMACPITCQTALGGIVWDENKVDGTQEILKSSGHTEIFPQASDPQTEYDSVYIGHVVSGGLSSELHSNGNTGIIGHGVTVADKVIGGYVSVIVAEEDYEGVSGEWDYDFQVNGNAIILQNGSTVKTVFGGYGYTIATDFAGGGMDQEIDDTQEGEASFNAVTVEKGAKAGTIYGGKAGLLYQNVRQNPLKPSQLIYDIEELNTVISALNNTVTVTGGEFQSAYGGYAEGRKASARNNTVLVEEGSCAVFSADAEDTSSVITGGYAGGNWHKDGGDAEASDNIVTVVKSSVYTVTGGKACGRKGTATMQINLSNFIAKNQRVKEW